MVAAVLNVGEDVYFDWGIVVKDNLLSNA